MKRKFLLGLLIFSSLVYAAEVIDEEIIKDLEFYSSLELIKDLDLIESAEASTTQLIVEEESNENKE